VGPATAGVGQAALPDLTLPLALAGSLPTTTSAAPLEPALYTAILITYIDVVVGWSSKIAPPQVAVYGARLI